jgi:hypothetical protein
MGEEEIINHQAGERNHQSPIFQSPIGVHEERIAGAGCGVLWEERASW